MAETLAQEGEAWLVKFFVLKKQRVLYIFKKSNNFI